MKRICFVFVLALAPALAGAQMPNTLSAADKIYGLSKFWQEVNYNFVYLNKVDRAAWDSLYRSMIVSVQATKDDYEFYREMDRFCAFLQDGHTNIRYPQGVDSLLYTSMFGRDRLFLTNIDGRAIVTRTNPGLKDGVPIGSEITKVNGLRTQDYLRLHVTPYISSSTGYVRDDLAVQRLLRGPRGSRFEITFVTPAGEERRLALVHEKSMDEEVYPPFEKRELLDLTWHPGGIAQVALNSFGDRRIDTLFFRILPELRAAKGLIIDLRNNGGGSTGIGTTILRYLTNSRVLFGSRTSSRLHIPAYKAWGSWQTAADTGESEWARTSYLHFHDAAYHTFDWDPDTNAVADSALVVPTALLISHMTASAAEDFLIAADGQKHMTKIGQRSFGSTGQPFAFPLPGGGSARVCTKRDTYPDGREFVGAGVKPDIEITPTVRDFIENRDPVLDAALRHLREAVH
jgi:C-terminal processing protease CtpA/Prc